MILPSSVRPAVLVVDDDPRGLQAVAVALEPLDVEIVTASTDDAALRELLRRDHALVLMDVRLGTTDGFTVAQTIRDRPGTRALPIIFLTGLADDPRDVLRGYEVGGVDYVAKPFSPELLRAKVRVFVELHERTAQVRQQAVHVQELEREAGQRRLTEARREWETQTLRTQVDRQQELDRRKDEFIAMLAHELRNPLTPVSTGLDFISDETAEMPQVTRACQAMRRHLDHVVRLVDDLLDVSRISENKLTLRREPVDVRACIEHAVDTMRAAIATAEQRLVLHLRDTPIVCDADPARVTQIVTNLLANATRYTPRGGGIAIAADVDGGEAVISVRDTGIGIDPGRIDQIFEKFVQAQSGAMGLGVGLTMVRKLAELHGGTAHARSEGVGRGSQFEVRIPLGARTPPSVAPSEARTQLEPVPPLRILVVDDEQDIRELLDTLLTAWGHVVETAGTGADAIERAAAMRPDLVLLDIGLPDMDGYDVANRIRAHLGPACPRVVAVTGYGQDEDRSRAEQAGIDERLLKPPTREALQRVIRKVARRSARLPR